MNSEIINLLGLAILTILVYIGYKNVKVFSFNWFVIQIIIQIIYKLIRYK